MQDFNNRKEFDYSRRRFDLWVDDLKRRNIYPLALDSYGEMTGFLTALELQANRGRIFISGSHPDSSLHDLCRFLGAELAFEGLAVISACGENIGEYVLAGALGEFARSGVNYQRLIEATPWMRLERGLPPELVQERREIIRRRLIGSCSICIFLSGSEGTLAEFKLALALKRFILPVGFSGGSAEVIAKDLLNTERAASSPATNKPHTVIEVVEDLLTGARNPPQANAKRIMASVRKVTERLADLSN
jgi:hypothetical protein